MICSKHKESCYLCNGTGKVTDSTESKKYTCNRCNGRGYVKGNHNFSYSYTRRGMWRTSISEEVYRCEYCGSEEVINDSTGGYMKLEHLNF